MKTFCLMAAIGKIELDNFRVRSNLDKRGTAKRGRLPAGSPYGYRIGDDGRPEAIDEQAEVVHHILGNATYTDLGSMASTVTSPTGRNQGLRPAVGHLD